MQAQPDVLNLLYREHLGPATPARLYHTEIVVIFRTPRSAPLFTTQLRVQPSPDACKGPRGDQAIENARDPRRGWKNASIVENERSVGLGFSMGSERAPRKLGGGVRNEREERNNHSRYLPLSDHN